jgi:hypothetical protein
MIDACTADAVKYLDDASAEGDGSLHSMVQRHLAAMQGIGYAVLAVHDKLGELADAADDSNQRLAEIADVLAQATPDPADRISWRQRWPLLTWRLWGERRAARALGQITDSAATTRIGPDDRPVLLQALADAASLRQGTIPGDCMDCASVQADAEAAGQPDAAAGLERCDAHARHEYLAAAYAELRFRLLDGAS